MEKLNGTIDKRGNCHFTVEESFVALCARFSMAVKLDVSQLTNTHNHCQM